MNYRRVLCLLAVALTLAACKGGYSFTGASIPPNAKTISVATFPNYASTVNPQLSQKLTDDLRNLFASQTSLNVVNGDADLEVSGEITSYVTRAAALSSNDEVSMNRLTHKEIRQQLRPRRQFRDLLLALPRLQRSAELCLGRKLLDGRDCVGTL